MARSKTNGLAEAIAWMKSHDARNGIAVESVMDAMGYPIPLKPKQRTPGVKVKSTARRLAETFIANVQPGYSFESHDAGVGAGSTDELLANKQAIVDSIRRAAETALSGVGAVVTEDDLADLV